MHIVNKCWKKQTCQSKFNMYLAPLIGAGLLVATSASNETLSFPERQLKLSRYQDAWKSILNPAKRYVKYRSYSNDEVFGGKSKCLFIQQTKHNSSNHTAETIMGYYNSTLKKFLNRTACTSVAKTEPYNETANVVRAASCQNSSLYADSPIIFSDYETCDVARAPHTGNPLDCELWVSEAYINNVTSICEFAYDVFCNTTMKFPIYDPCICIPQEQ